MFADYVDGLRELAEARMDESSRVTVRRDTGNTVTDETTGRELPERLVIDSDVPFRLGGPGDGGSQAVTVDGVEYREATALGHLPAAFADLQDNDTLTVTSGEWVGSTWRVIKATRADQKTARRVPIVEV